MRPSFVRTPRARGCAGAALASLLALAGAGRRAEADVRYLLRGEIGAEHDTNPSRLERVADVDRDQPPIEGSPLGRAVLSADLGAPLGRRHAVGLSSSVAGKLFTQPRARDEDVVVLQLAGAYNLYATDSSVLGAALGYYDVMQRTDDAIAARDFRSLAPALRFDQGIFEGRLSVAVGWRQFTYKPDRRFDFAGPTGSLWYRHALAAADVDEAEWEWSFGATAEGRSFADGANTVCPATGRAIRDRRDVFWSANADVTRTGDALLGAGVSAQSNLSSCPGESLTRLLLHVRGAYTLPWRLDLSGRADLAFTDYTQGVPLARDPVSGVPLVSIEDENRSRLRLELVRPVGEGVDLGLRYTLYTNEIGRGPVTFRRQTLLVFAAISFER